MTESLLQFSFTNQTGAKEGVTVLDCTPKLVRLRTDDPAAMEEFHIWVDDIPAMVEALLMAHNFAGGTFPDTTLVNRLKQLVAQLDIG